MLNIKLIEISHRESDEGALNIKHSRSQMPGIFQRRLTGELWLPLRLNCETVQTDNEPNRSEVNR